MNEKRYKSGKTFKSDAENPPLSVNCFLLFYHGAPPECIGCDLSEKPLYNQMTS